MKRLLLATTALIALGSAAKADLITVTATVDGVLVGAQSSGSGILNVAAQSFGPVYNINNLSINSQTMLAPPGILSTNSLNVDQNVGGIHSLVLDVTAFGLTGPNALTALLSSFSVSGQSNLWNVQEQTFINGTLLSDTGVFTGVSDNANDIQSAFLGTTYNAEAIYTINSFGVGQFNGGIDIQVAAVPEPSTWAMMLLGFGGIAFLGMRKHRKGLSFA